VLGEKGAYSTGKRRCRPSEFSTGVSRNKDPGERREDNLRFGGGTVKLCGGGEKKPLANSKKGKSEKNLNPQGQLTKGHRGKKKRKVLEKRKRGTCIELKGKRGNLLFVEKKSRLDRPGKSGGGQGHGGRKK